MTLCFLSYSQFDEFTGGVERVCCLLSREFIKRGFKIIYLYGKPSKLGRPAEGCEGDGQYQFPYENIWDKRNDAYCVEILKKHSVDVVIDVSYISRYHDIAYKAKEEYSFKLISTCHSDPFCDLKELRDNFDEIAFRQSNLIKRLSQQLLFLLKLPVSYYVRKKSLKERFQKRYDESDAYVFLCDGYAKKIQKFLHVPEGKIVSINNPIISSSIKSSIKRNQMIFIGRLVFQKRLDRILKIWEKVEQKDANWDLAVIGDGDYFEEYKKYAQKLKLRRISFLGQIPSTEVLSQSKIILMASTHEGFPMVLLEALSVGVIPICFESFDSIHSIFNNNESGFIVKPYSTSQYISKILHLVNSPEVLETMSEKCISQAKKFDIERITNLWINLFESLIK